MDGLEVRVQSHIIYLSLYNPFPHSNIAEMLSDDAWASDNKS